VATGKVLLTLYGHADNVEDVVFSPDGRYLFSGSVDGTARMYVLPVDELVALAKARVTRGFTADECQTYLPDMPCPAKP
jgi:Tol biopolymer transport system component